MRFLKLDLQVRDAIRGKVVVDQPAELVSEVASLARRLVQSPKVTDGTNTTA